MAPLTKSTDFETTIEEGPKAPVTGAQRIASRLVEQDAY